MGEKKNMDLGAGYVPGPASQIMGAAGGTLPGAAPFQHAAHIGTGDYQPFAAELNESLAGSEGDIGSLLNRMEVLIERMGFQIPPVNLVAMEPQTEVPKAPDSFKIKTSDKASAISRGVERLSGLIEVIEHEF